jgi:hypothetical protein
MEVGGGEGVETLEAIWDEEFKRQKGSVNRTKTEGASFILRTRVHLIPRAGLIVKIKFCGRKIGVVRLDEMELHHESNSGDCRGGSKRGLVNSAPQTVKWSIWMEEQ